MLQTVRLCLLKMPVTRSSTRSVSNNVSATKRKADDLNALSKTSQKKPRMVRAVSSSPPAPLPQVSSSSQLGGTDGSTAVLVSASLTFSFEKAKEHLIGVDHRFEDIFNKMTCRPFQQLERVHPFRALVTSILGQQISWMAARSISHKFIKLYDPSLPEKPADFAATKSPTSFFPSPEQVANTDLATLKTAGLSTRKAEYVQDLASRFADGRLSTQKLIEADDEELAQMLIEVRGIGRWTVDMFAIFSLRRPDILPVGDLGVQRGLLRWFLSLHSPSHPFSISPEKVGGQSAEKKRKKGAAGAKTKGSDNDALPVFEQAAEPESQGCSDLANATSPDITSIPPGNVLSTPLLNGGGSELPSMPAPFTPSIKKTLNNRKATGQIPVPLPECLTVAILKSRLEGKKKIKGAFLTPKEMEDLTECWKPYRSIGVYYMWSLTDCEI